VDGRLVVAAASLLALLPLTTVCPLTTQAMLDAKAMLGAAGARVQLLGIDANPKATSLEDVLSYSELHGMLHSWHFLTGALGAAPARVEGLASA
jgi:cytochrome oxidase Cu insertion factor (SCO1/SenC/PrrC family)